MVEGQLELRAGGVNFELSDIELHGVCRINDGLALSQCDFWLGSGRTFISIVRRGR